MNLGVLGFEPNDAGSNPAACKGELQEAGFEPASSGLKPSTPK